MIQRVSPFLKEVQIGFCSLTFLSSFSQTKEGIPPKKVGTQKGRDTAENLPC